MSIVQESPSNVVKVELYFSRDFSRIRNIYVSKFVSRSVRTSNYCMDLSAVRL